MRPRQLFVLRISCGLLGAAILMSLNPCATAATPAVASAAQRPVGSEEAHSTRIILLGTAGGPGVDRDRSEPANLLVVDGRPYLIDAGAGVSRQLLAAGYQTYQVHRIFFTHLHLDHSAGLPVLMAFDWFYSTFPVNRFNLSAHSTPPFQIYGPPATKFLVHASLQYLSVSERIFRAGITAMLPAAPFFEGHDINVGNQQEVVYQDDLVRVSAVQNSHYHAYSGSPQTGQDKSYSYRFDTPSGSVVITGDTGPGATDAIAKLGKGADVLVSEVRAAGPAVPSGAARSPNPSATAGPRITPEEAEEIAAHMTQEHLTPQDVGRLASAADVKVVLLTHFVPAGDVTDMRRFTAGVSEHFHGTVIPGNDLFEYDLFKH